MSILSLSFKSEIIPANLTMLVGSSQYSVASSFKYGFNTYNTLQYYSPPPPYSSPSPEPHGRASIPPELTRLNNYVYNLVNTFSGGKACYVNSYVDELYGVVVRVTIGLPAREALELWLKLIEHLKIEKYDVTVAVEWLGEKNLNEDELVDYITKIMIKSGTKPKALPGFDSVSIVRKERGG